MQTTIKKWGNSQGIRIPASIIKECKLNIDQPVNITLENDAIVIRPLPRKKHTLEQLLRSVTQENLHDDIDSAGPAGNEIW